MEKTFQNLDMKISLREITESTLISILKLEVSEHQKNFVASNAVSIAQAHFSKTAWFRGIYFEDSPIGFVMIDDNPEKTEYFLWRFMIDKGFQGKGYGKDAMKCIIEHVKTRPGAVEFLLSCVPGDEGPEGFYKKLGFEFTGEVDEDEEVYRLTF